MFPRVAIGYVTSGGNYMCVETIVVERGSAQQETGLWHVAISFLVCVCVGVCGHILQM